MSAADKVEVVFVEGFSIQRAVLLPLLAGIAVLILVLAAANWWLDRQIKNFLLHNDAQEIGLNIRNLLAMQRLVFRNHLLLLAENEALLTPFLAGDRQGLLHKSQAILQAFQEQKITHFYYHLPNRVNLLRVHNPPLHGDRVDRYLLQQAEKSGDFAFGTEIGKIGTLTARGILPWKRNGQVVGYLEIGKEFTHLVTELGQQNKLQLFPFVDKSYLDRQLTMDGLALLNIPTRWDSFTHLLHLGGNGQTLPDGLKDYIDSGYWRSEQFEKTVFLSDNNPKHLYFSIPVRDTLGRTVARIVVLRHHEQIHQLAMFHHTLILGMVSLLAAILGSLFYKVLGSIEKRVRESTTRLQASEQSLAKAHEIAQLGNWELAVDSRIMTCSPQIRHMAGNLSPHAGMPLEQFLATLLPDQCVQFEQALQEVINRQRHRFDLELQLADTPDRYIQIRGEGLRDQDGHLTRIIGTLQDISQRRLLEEHIRKNEFFLRNTVESIHDGLLVIDNEGQIVMANSRFVSLWALPAEWITWPLESRLLPLMMSHLSNADNLVANVLHGFETAGASTLRFHDGRYFDWYTFPLKCQEQVCGCVWRFTDTTTEHLAEKREERAMQSRIAISALLETGMEPLSLHRQLDVALDIILTVPWLSIQRKGTLFLANNQTGELRLYVEKGVNPALATTCDRVPFGHCLCGKAAQNREILFSDHVDHQHDIRYADITGHGHYCVPILSATHLKGVLNLYLTEGHVSTLEEEAFLSTVANILAGLIDLRETELRLVAEKDFSATVLRTAPALVTVMDGEGTVLLFNRACQQITGMTEHEALGRKIWEFPIHPEEQEQLRQFFARLSANPLELQTLEHTWMCFPHDECLIEWHLASTLNPDGSTRNVIGAGIDITHRKQTEKLLQHLAGHDPLTGLANRRLFGEHLTKAIAYAQRDRKRLAVLFLDLDHFKEINDQHGHEAGDGVLQEAANRIQGEIRRSDTMARLGGDEFTLVVSNVEETQDPMAVARKIIEEVGRPFLCNHHPCHIGVSIGISLFPDHGEDAETLLNHADQAMYQAKQKGRNRFALYSSAAAAETRVVSAAAEIF